MNISYFGQVVLLDFLELIFLKKNRFTSFYFINQFILFYFQPTYFVNRIDPSHALTTIFLSSLCFLPFIYHRKTHKSTKSEPCWPPSALCSRNKSSPCDPRATQPFPPQSTTLWTVANNSPPPPWPLATDHATQPLLISSSWPRRRRISTSRSIYPKHLRTKRIYQKTYVYTNNVYETTIPRKGSKQGLLCSIETRANLCPKLLSHPHPRKNKSLFWILKILACPTIISLFLPTKDTNYNLN